MLPDDINTVMSVTDSCSSTYLYATAPYIMRFQIGARTSPTVVMTWEVRCSSPFFDVCEVCLYLTVFLYLKHWQKASHQLIVTVQNKVIWLLLKIEFLLNNTGLILTCVWTEVPLSSAYLQIRWLRETRGRVFFTDLWIHKLFNTQLVYKRIERWNVFGVTWFSATRHHKLATAETGSIPIYCRQKLVKQTLTIIDATFVTRIQTVQLRHIGE